MKKICYFFLLICVCGRLVAAENPQPPATQVAAENPKEPTAQIAAESPKIATAKAAKEKPKQSTPKVKTKNPKHSTICLNMIVKNESKVITRCLETVKPMIDYWVIVDTGSKDGTQKIIKNFMKDIPGELHERPWVDFASNRNEALQLADGKADYIFFLDADDSIKISSNFRKKLLDKDSYLIDIHYGGMTYGRTALVKSFLPWKWVGVVHEVIVCDAPTSSGLLDDVTMQIIGGGDRSHDPQKFLKDAALLEKALQEKPDEARYQFYLAQSYRDAGEQERSLLNYEKRVAMGGWDQEVFWSLYQVAELKESLKKEEAEVVKAYTAAYFFRPSRLEPLHRLCAYYRQKENYLMGYLVGNFALNAFALESRKGNAHPLNDLPVEPKQLELQVPKDVLFLESWVYDYDFLLEYSICAYWIGKYQEAKDISNYLLSKPNLDSGVRECLQSNRDFSVMKLNERPMLKAG